MKDLKQARDLAQLLRKLSRNSEIANELMRGANTIDDLTNIIVRLNNLLNRGDKHKVLADAERIKAERNKRKRLKSFIDAYEDGMKTPKWERDTARNTVANEKLEPWVDFVLEGLEELYFRYDDSYDRDMVYNALRLIRVLYTLQDEHSPKPNKDTATEQTRDK